MIVAWLIWQRRAPDRSSRGVSLALYALAALPAIALLAWFNTHLYGAPLRAGYGWLDPLFDAAFVMPNARNYSAWFVESQGIAATVLGIVAFGLALLAGPGMRRTLALFAAAVVALYLPYVAFDVWWFLRFLLPAYPPLLILIASMLWAAARRVRRRWARAAAIGVAAMRARFIEPGELAFLDQPPVAEIRSSPRVRVYAISDDVPPAPTVFVDPGRARPVAPVNPRVASWEPQR